MSPHVGKLPGMAGERHLLLLWPLHHGLSKHLFCTIGKVGLPFATSATMYTHWSHCPLLAISLVLDALEVQVVRRYETGNHLAARDILRTQWYAETGGDVLLPSSR